LPSPVAVRTGGLAPQRGAALLGPPCDQCGILLSPVGRREAGEEVVHADGVSEALVVGDTQGAVTAISEGGEVDAFFRGEYGGAGRAEDVVVRGGARADGLVRAEALQYSHVVQAQQPLAGGGVGVEEELGELR